MTLKGHVQGGVVVLDEAVELPDGTEVQVEVAGGRDETVLGKKLMAYAGRAKGLPRDLAAQHDHYLHGTRKK